MKQALLAITILGVILLLLNAKSSSTDDIEISEKGIEFHHGNWDEALARAKAENKLIFLDIYATWCGPCKLLKKKTFSDESVGSYYNDKYINVALNGEEGDGKLLAQQYAIKGYPSLLFINGEGKLVAKSAGYVSPEDFLDMGKQIDDKIIN